MLRWKDTCRFDNLCSAMVLAILRADAIYEAAGVGETWLTSVNDSTHSTTSKHYDGRAVDFRVHNIMDSADQERIATRLRIALGPQFTVLYEAVGTPNAHIHVQFNGAAG